MDNVRVNKWLDLLDRVGWTFVQSLVGAFVVLGWSDWREALGIAAGAAVVAAAKVMLAQRAGSDELGSAVPGQVLERAYTP